MQHPQLCTAWRSAALCVNSPDGAFPPNLSKPLLRNTTCKVVASSQNLENCAGPMPPQLGSKSLGSKLKISPARATVHDFQSIVTDGQIDLSRNVLSLSQRPHELLSLSLSAGRMCTSFAPAQAIPAFGASVTNRLVRGPRRAVTARSLSLGEARRPLSPPLAHIRSRQGRRSRYQSIPSTGDLRQNTTLKSALTWAKLCNT